MKSYRGLESKLKPVALEIAFNIDSQMEKMSEDEIFQKFPKLKMQIHQW
ncbi:MAG: hypothetical protein Ct9H300mP17_04140 [Candidatus Nitrosopelagicus sp.]|nr:MAG: hypothetical protein Ct9H300mP17_04140 [Candidatus Nitrosopelagicus sp.]